MKHQRPARVLIEILNELPEEVLELVSPSSVTLKRYIKVPMLLLLINASTQSGLGTVFMKLIGELIVSGDAKNYITMLLILVICMVLATLSQGHSINLAIKHFDQLEVMPIFMVTVMCLWMFSGMWILQES